MSGEAGLLDIVDLLYGAALDASLWPAALDATSDLLDSEGANLEVIDKATGRPVDFKFGRLPGEATEAYVDYYSSVCPRSSPCMAEPAGYICHDREVLSEEEIAHDEFYADFLRPIGLKYFISGNLINNDRYLSVIAAQRSPQQGHVGTREIRLMRLLIPHFTRSLAISARLAAARVYDHGPDGVVHLSPIGFLFLDRRARVTSINPAAARIISENSSVLSLRGGSLKFFDSDLQSRLLRYIGNAVNTTEPDQGNTILVHREGQLPLKLVVARLPRLSPLAELTDGAVAVIYLTDGTAVYTTTEAVLHREFALTPAECRLALALLHGRSLREYADESCLRLSTVRTHAARIFEKTGSRNQQTLIRLLAHLAATA